MRKWCLGEEGMSLEKDIELKTQAVVHFKKYADEANGYAFMLELTRINDLLSCMVSLVFTNHAFG